MVDRIYTQADYDKVTDLYNEYQNKKWSYTPEQQQKIEDAFWNARWAMTERIAASKNKIANMWNDEQWNSRAEYWDGRREIVNYAPQPVKPATPKPTPRRIPDPTPEPTPEPTPNSDVTWWFDTTGWFKTHDWWYASPDLMTKIWPNWSVSMWERVYDPAIIWSYRVNDDWTAEFYGKWWSRIYVSDPKSYEDMKVELEPRQKEWWEYLMKYSKWFRNDVQRILDNGWYITADWFLKRADWSVVTKL